VPAANPRQPQSTAAITPVQLQSHTAAAAVQQAVATRRQRVLPLPLKTMPARMLQVAPRRPECAARLPRLRPCTTYRCCRCSYAASRMHACPRPCKRKTSAVATRLSSSHKRPFTTAGAGHRATQLEGAAVLWCGHASPAGAHKRNHHRGVVHLAASWKHAGRQRPLRPHHTTPRSLRSRSCCYPTTHAATTVHSFTTSVSGSQLRSRQVAASAQWWPALHSCAAAAQLQHMPHGLAATMGWCAQHAGRRQAEVSRTIPACAASTAQGDL
jgi:hypothetical protein